MVLISIAWYPIKYLCIKKFAYFVLNKYYTKRHHYVTTPLAVWEDMRSDGRMDSWNVIAVYDRSTLITIGMVDDYSALDAPEFELQLSRQSKLAALRGKYPESFVIDDEYYNAGTGVRIVWYDQKRIEEYWFKMFDE
jgi:hypothetical protein